MSATAIDTTATIIDQTTGEVVPLDQGHAPALRLDTHALAERQNEIAEALRTNLQENIHYGRIPGTPKPTLLKAGAEWLLRYAGYGVDFDGDPVVERDEDGKFLGVSYKAVVFIPTAEGRRMVVSACEAYAGHDESKWAKAPRNTVMKMAQKRAIVGAVLLATGASSMFTQDLEDYERAAEEKQEANERRRQVADPDVFRKAFHATLGELTIEEGTVGTPDEAKRAFLRKFYEVGSTNDLDESQRAALLALIRAEATDDKPSGKERLEKAIRTAWDEATQVEQAQESAGE